MKHSLEITQNVLSLVAMLLESEMSLSLYKISKKYKFNVCEIQLKKTLSKTKTTYNINFAQNHIITQKEYVVFKYTFECKRRSGETFAHISYVM